MSKMVKQETNQHPLESKGMFENFFHKLSEIAANTLARLTKKPSLAIYN